MKGSRVVHLLVPQILLMKSPKPDPVTFEQRSVMAGTSTNSLNVVSTRTIDCWVSNGNNQFESGRCNVFLLS